MESGEKIEMGLIGYDYTNFWAAYYGGELYTYILRKFIKVIKVA